MLNNPEDRGRPATVLSKTQRKKDMHALQEIGERLVELDQQKLSELNLPEILIDAINLARIKQKHGAHRRQMQYIGKLMRNIDVLPIQEKLESWQETSLFHTARLHQLEYWRERLLTDEHALNEFAQKYPAADLQRLRLLIRNAQKEKASEKSPKNFRLLFQALRATINVI